MKIRPLTAALLLLATPCFAGFSGDGFGTRGFFQYVVSSGATNMTTPVFGNALTPASGSVGYFGPVGGASGTPTGGTSTSRRVPIPIAGTVKGANCWQAVANTTITLTDNINGTDGTTVCNFSGGQNATSSGSGDAINAGDLFQWHWAGTFAASTLYTQSFLFVASGQNGMLLGGAYNVGTGTTGTIYQELGGAGNASTEISASAVLPSSFTVNGFYEIPNGTENTVPHVFNVFLNGAAVSTPVTCTNTASTATGCCVDANPTGKHVGGASGPSCTSMTPFHVSAGDTLSIQEVCASTCVSINPGVSLAIAPDVANQAPITAVSNVNWTANAWLSLSDNQVLTAQTNYQITPVAPTNITFSNLIACATTITGAGAARNVAAQTGASPGTAPSGSAGPVVIMATGGSACPGAAGSSFGSGGQDTTHTFNATSGQTLDYGLTVTATPGTNAILKVGMVGVVH